MNHHSFEAMVLVPGTAVGEALVLLEPLSLWGGLDPATGEIIDRRHPNAGQMVSGKVLLLPVGRGSSSASSILLEAVRQGRAPAAILTAEVDGILALGAAVAWEMYDQAPPVLVLPPAAYNAIRTGDHLTIREDGTLTVSRPLPDL